MERRSRKQGHGVGGWLNSLWSVLLSACLVSLQCVPPGFAAEFTVFKRAYVREASSPQSVSESFSVLDPATSWKLRAVNGSLKDTSVEKVSSSTLSLNGVEVLKPNQFSQSVSFLEAPVNLQSSNTIVTELRSKPGGQLTVEIIGEDSNPPILTWLSPAEGAFFNTDTVTASLQLTDDISGLDPSSLSITLDGVSALASFDPPATASLSQILRGTLTLTEGFHSLSAEGADLAAQGSSGVVSFTVDRTPPAITTQLDPSPNSFGWNNSPLTVSFSCTDHLSGVVSCPSPVVVEQEGLNQTVSGTAMDRAGNSSSTDVTVNVDTHAPAITELSPSQGSIVTSAHPTISASFSDSLSGVAVSSVSLSLDGTDVSAQSLITESSMIFIVSSALVDGLHTIILSLSDQAGNALSESVSFTVQTLIEPPVNPDSGFIHGQVFDASTSQPLSGASITLRGTTSVQSSSSDGRFQLSTPSGGSYVVEIAKSGYTSVQRPVSVLAGRDVAVADAFLTPLDLQTTLITQASGGKATDSSGDFQLDFPAGASPLDLQVRITPLHEDHQLPGPVPSDMAHIEAVYFEPRFTTFNQPVSFKHRNTKHLPAGLSVILTLWDETAQVWLDAGTGTVSADGEWVEFRILRFFCWYCSRVGAKLPAQSKSPDWEDVTETTSEVIDSAKECQVTGNSSVCLHSGELSITHRLPNLRSLGQSHAPEFLYRSLRANPSVVVGTDYQLNTASIPGDPGTLVPVTTSTMLQIEGQRLEAHFLGKAGQTRQAFLWDARNARGEWVPTGAYAYTIELSNNYQTTFGTSGIPTPDLRPLTRSIAGRAIVVNERACAFGAGWNLKTLEHIFPQPDGTVLVTDGDGSASVLRAGPMLDIAVANFSSSDVSLLTGHGDGTFQPQQRISLATPTGSSVPYWLTAADFNQDGFQDMAVVLIEGKVAILLGRGGTFDPPQRFEVGGGPIFIVEGDVNRDGQIDLVVVNQTSNDVSVLLGNGDGTFQSQRRVVVGRLPESAAVGDVNQDGYLDLVVANRGELNAFGITGDSLSILLGHGDGTFGSQQTFAVGMQPRSVALRDLNRDGRLDVVMVRNNQGRIAVFLGNGDGTFQGPTDYPAGATSNSVLALSDFNEDGLTDVAVSDQATQVISLFFGAGDGTFLPRKTLGAFVAGDMTVADFNQDGHPDLAASGAGQDFFVFLGNGDGTFQPFLRLTVGSQPFGIAVAEFDSRAGDSDRIFSGLPGDFSVLRKHPDGTWTRRLSDGTGVHFDARGFHTKTLDRSGNETRYVYDSQDRLVRVEYPGGVRFDLSYDSTTGKLASITDSANRATQFTIDSDGNLIEILPPPCSSPLAPCSSSAHFSYDPEHRLVSKTDERGFTTDYVYDSWGRIDKVLSPARDILSPLTGQITSERETRDFLPSEVQGLINTLPEGLGTPSNPSFALPIPLALFQDGRGNLTRLLTDPYGAPTKIVDSLGRTSTIQRDVNGSPTKITRPDGSEVFLGYDGLGNLSSSRETVTISSMPSFFQQREYRFQYEPQFSQLTKIVDARRDSVCPNGCVTTIDHDSQGNPLTITDALGNASQFRYDSRGLLVSSMNALGSLTQFSYDSLTGNLLSSTDSLNRSTSFSYDSTGNVASSRDAFGTTTQFTYDSLNRLTSVTDAQGNVTRYAFDPAGNLIEVRPPPCPPPPAPCPSSHQFAYDSLNQLISSQQIARTKQYFYDLSRNLVRILDPKGQTINFLYDSADQLIQKRLSDSSAALTDTLSYTYDALGNLTLVQDNDSRLRFGYDSVGRLIKATSGDSSNPSLAQPVTELQYSYDPNGNRTLLLGPVNIQTAYTYDVLNRVIGVSDRNGVGARFEYDALSRLIRKSAGAETTYGYDSASQLIHLQTLLGSTLIDTFSYSYDLRGNRVNLTDRFGLHSYAYDSLSRLIAAAHPSLSGLVPEQFSYDSVGNRLSSHLSTSYGYDDANRLLEDDSFTYAYDANGNLIEKRPLACPSPPAPCLSSTVYSYDVENQLIKIQHMADSTQHIETTYRYDGLGRRIEKAVNGVITRYVYDNEDVVALYDQAGCWKQTIVHGPGIDDPIGFIQDTNANCNATDAAGFPEPARVLNTDALGSITSLLSETVGFQRAIVLRERYVYDSFGNLTITDPNGTVLPSSGYGNLYFFTGREYDFESGLYYNRHRYRDPLTGRFMQEDPVFNINLYPYARNNPVNFTDPFGEQPFGRCLMCGVTSLGFGSSLPPLPGVDIPLPNPLTDKKGTTVCPLESDEAEGGEVVCNLVDQSEDNCQYQCSDGGFVNLNRKRLGGTCPPTIIYRR